MVRICSFEHSVGYLNVAIRRIMKLTHRYLRQEGCVLSGVFLFVCLSVSNFT